MLKYISYSEKRKIKLRGIKMSADTPLMQQYKKIKEVIQNFLEQKEK